ncbi:type I-B CRISPR-associated protein Cas5b [Aneurinibacillus aneurinilyticus]|uniref:Type I-B CRISPR-associated protein Cas5 n=1 Tax=Aneurinibacillus aneurinilyticus TaxID=1391 RepID=A0A848CWU3_ANEAE|nr:type I-B CRISPR-associated protein Cas5b [Aneurinibacillus aneurinilyticus]NME99401.1 type I-B CRISPR-associated protein Cas5 [Aneurinibacillus aneurinilyticus]
MKALRLMLYQQTACYKKPFAFKVAETYPLPPHSTVKGMLHALLGATSLIPMRISVQGGYDTIMTDYQTHYFFKSNKTAEFMLTADGLGIERGLKEVTTMPIYSHMLYDVYLLLHVQAEDEVLEQIYHQFNNNMTHLSLGRWEDLVRVDECKLVELHTYEEECVLKYNAYVPKKLLGDAPHFPYKLNWTYRIIQGVRVWDKLNVGYVQAGSPLVQEDGIWIDDHKDYVFFAN